MEQVLIGGLLMLGVFFGNACMEVYWRWDHWGGRVGCLGSLDKNVTATEPSSKQNWLLLLVNIMQIALAKCRRERRASHQPAFMDSSLTISHTCFP